MYQYNMTHCMTVLPWLDRLFIECIAKGAVPMGWRGACIVHLQRPCLLNSRGGREQKKT